MNSFSSPHPVQLHGVTKMFGSHAAVKEMDLQISQGSVYGFIGPNGSGKTTTLRMILRILHPNSGRVVVLGQDHGAAADDRVGYLPEERGLYRKMRVRDVIEFFGRLKGLSPCRREAMQWLERLDLADWAGKKVQTLSKGMSQKVQFIAAVIARPQLLVLDEPFSGLDPLNTEVLKDAILSLQREGTTILFSTHDMSVAERMCDAVCMIFRGEKVLDGSLESIQSQYGQDTIRLRAAEPDSLTDVPGVLKCNDYGRLQELRVEKNVETRTVLEAILKRTSVEQFERVQPSLHDIFVRLAGSE